MLFSLYYLQFTKFSFKNLEYQSSASFLEFSPLILNTLEIILFCLLIKTLCLFCSCGSIHFFFVEYIAASITLGVSLYERPGELTLNFLYFLHQEIARRQLVYFYIIYCKVHIIVI